MHPILLPLLFTLLSSSPLASCLAPFCVNARLRLPPSAVPDFLKAIRHDQKETLEREAGALQFLLMEDVGEEGVFYSHEEYASEEAFGDHCESPHYKQWSAFASKEPFLGEVEVNKYEARGEKEVVTREEREKVGEGGEKYCVWVNLFPKKERLEEFLGTIEQNKRGTDEDEPMARQ